MRMNPTIATYNRYAHAYDQEVVEFWDNFPAEFIDKFSASLSGKRILNLGSGSGRDALLLRDRGLEVVCVDASKSMIDITKRLGFESHLASFSELDFPHKSFAGVWAYTSLIHVPKAEAEKVIKNIHLLLKPKGTFAIGVIEGDTAGMVERKTMHGAARYFKNYRPIELKTLVESRGFTFAYEQDYQPNNKIYLNHIYKKSN